LIYTSTAELPPRRNGRAVHPERFANSTAEAI
jgi:hypothetical protein